MTNPVDQPHTQQTPANKMSRASKRTLLLLSLVSAAPIVAAFIAYFTDWRPQRSTNYGDLVIPQRPVPPLQLSSLDQKPVDLNQFKGRWIMLSVDRADCATACAEKLHAMRQIRLSTGKDQNRLERVWLITDQQPVPTLVIRAYDGTHMLRANSEQLAQFLPLDAKHPTDLSEHIWLIDPRGNLMMRFPKNADPLLIRKDIAKLLHNSRIG